MLTLSVIPRGSPVSPRYILSNQDGQFWNGESWDEEKKALLYNDLRELSEVCRTLGEQAVEGLPVTRFVVPCEIKVCGDTPIDLTDMKLWLMKAARLYVDLAQGIGPKGNMALLSINWLNLEQKADGDSVHTD